MSEKFKQQEDYLTLDVADKQARHEIAKMTPEQFEQAELEQEAMTLFRESGVVGDVLKYDPNLSLDRIENSSN